MVNPPPPLGRDLGAMEVFWGSTAAAGLAGLGSALLVGFGSAGFGAVICRSLVVVAAGFAAGSVGFSGVSERFSKLGTGTF